MFFLALLVLCYVVGAVPTSYLLVKFLRGIDIRTVGSGNSGATNTGRVLGLPGFLSVLVIDVFKAYGALYICMAYGENDPLLMIAAAGALLLGNGYSPFLSFHGGKGVATTAGIVLFLFPPIMWLSYIVSFAALFFLVGRVDASSLGASAFGPLCAYLWGCPVVTLYGSLALAVWIWLRHASNIQVICIRWFSCNSGRNN